MNRQLLSCLLMASLASLTGCAMCVSSFDASYSAYGGKWQRVIPDQGRVGSLFDPADGPLLGPGEVVTEDVGMEDAGVEAPSVLKGSVQPQAEEAPDAPPVPQGLLDVQ
jgi:hypothetical protein